MPNKKNKKISRRFVPRQNVPRRLRGQGGFIDDLKGGWKKFSDWTHGAGKPFMDSGRAISDAFLPGSGSWLKQFTNILGLGAYTPVHGNTILASPVPVMHGLTDKGLRIMNHEFIRDVSSSAAFAIMRFGVNPGLKSTFPWLSDIAASFQKWEPNGIVFYYKATSATALNSTNTALGTVTGAVQYDVDEANPTNKTQMVNLAGSMSGPPMSDNLYPVECAIDMRITRNLLIRRGDIADDLQKYDLGAFLLSTVGSQATAVTGELHICYDITLKQPIQAGAEGNDLLGCHFSGSNADGTHPLGTATVEVEDGLGITISDSAGGTAYDTITVGAGNSGRFMVELIYSGTPAAWADPALTLTNCNGQMRLNNNTVTNVSVTAGVNTGKATYVLIVDVAEPTLPWSVKYGKAGTVPTAAYVDIYVSAVNKSF